MPTQSEIPWTQQQSAFFARLESTQDSLVLTSVAGSGKTTTLTEGATRLVGSVLALAFNVRIKKTLDERIGHFAVCKTINGVGHGAMCKFLGRKVRIDKDKTRKVVRDLLNEKENEHLWELFSSISQLVARAKHHGLIPAGTPGMFISLTEDTPDAWAEIAAHYDIHFDQDVYRLARLALRACNSQAFAGTCDFDDQIYIPALWGAPFDKFDNIIVDEAQDLSEIQHKILKKLLRKGGRLIAVGDENQAIYGFRAAMSNSIRRLITTFDLGEMELTISFRCCQSVVREAQKVVPRIEASPTAPEGSVLTLGGYSASTFQVGDTILCRNNAPLIKIAYKLIAEGRGVCVVGRDIGAGLKLLTKRIVGKDLTQPVTYLLQGLAEWQDQEAAKALAKDQPSKLEVINDKAESLFAIIDGSGATTIKDVISAIEELFGKTSAPITLSTIHRAKGMEWDRVFFLNQKLIPSIWAVKAHDKDPERYEWMMQEERNLRYVGVTRAREQLAYITTEGWENGTR